MTTPKRTRKRAAPAPGLRGHEIVAQATQDGRGTVDIARKLDAIQTAYKAGVLSKEEADERKAPLIGELHRAAEAEAAATRASIPFGVTLGTPVVVAGELIESAWGNQVRADLLALNAGKLETSGGTLTGNLTMSAGSFTVSNGLMTISTPGFGLALPAGEPSSPGRAARKDYVDAGDAARIARTGDTMTGGLIIDTAGTPVILRRTGDAPFADWQTVAGGLLARIQANSTLLSVNSQNALAFSSDNTERARLAGTSFMFGKTASDLNTTGVEILGTGSSVLGSIRSTTAAASNQNFYARHMSAADAGGELFAQFARSSAGTVIGAITQNGTTGVNYNTTSDRRLKTDRGAVEAAIAMLRRMPPRRAVFTEGGDEIITLYADEVQKVLPDAVTGKPDATLTAAKVKRQGFGNVGDIDPMLMDYGRIVPLLAACVLELADKADV